MGKLNSRSNDTPVVLTPHRRAQPAVTLRGVFMRIAIVVSFICPFAVAQPAPPAPPAAKPVAPMTDAKPSRYQLDHLDGFVTEMKEKLAMRNRTLGPFGELQDPEAKAAPKFSTLQTAKKPSEPSLSLSQIVERIEISTIMPREKRFLIGSRSISQGGQLPVSIQGKQIKLTITEVSSYQITFLNPATGESAQKKLNSLPPGMSSGSSSSSIPGMQRATQEAPIILDAPSP